MTVSTETLVPGALLAGKYKIEKKLGEGGMGAVFLAENTDIGRKVAIKVLHADFAANPDLIKRFRQEARAAAAIGHPGIVDVLDMGTTDDGSAFIVMERLEGQTLGARLEERGRLPVKHACTVVADVLDALAAAHDKHIIHRDLKPDNVFLVEKPVAMVKILDFGISKLQGSEDVALTRTGAVMGTPLYMSPEQARGAKDLAHPTDLYSMGAILYHVLVGAPPFTGDTYNEVLAKVLMEEPRSLAELRPGLPRKLVDTVAGLLAKEPKARPPARETAALLRQIAAQVTDERQALDSTMAAGPDTAASPVAVPIATPVPPGIAAPTPGAAAARPRADAGVSGFDGTLLPGAALPAGTSPHVVAQPGETVTGEPPRPVGATAVAAPGGGKKGLVYAAGGGVVAVGAVLLLVLGGGGTKKGGGPVAGVTAEGAEADAAVRAPDPPPVTPPTTPTGPVGPPPAPAKVKITLVAEPAEARWFLDDQPLYCNPCEVEKDRGARHVAVARAPGFVEQRLELGFDEGTAAQNIVLVAKGGAAKPPRGGDKPPRGGDKPPAGGSGDPGAGSGSGLTIDKNNPFKKPQ